MTPDEFFARYPHAPGVWICGGELFLKHGLHAARKRQRRLACELVWMNAPAPDTTTEHLPAEGDNDDDDAPE